MNNVFIRSVKWLIPTILCGLTLLGCGGSSAPSVSSSAPSVSSTIVGQVSTLAGSGTQGRANGSGTGASFGLMMTGVAVDSSGNVYVVDTSNFLIRKITPAGVVTTLAGSFSIPTGVAVDSSGNLYVTDRVNNSIVKMTPAGIITTLAGGSIGATNGTGTAASFNGPQSIAVDSSGNVYVADGGNNLIRKITPAGVVTTLAGSGTAGSTNGIGTAASFSSPYGIAADSSGNLYVTDKGNALVRKITY